MTLVAAAGADVPPQGLDHSSSMRCSSQISSSVPLAVGVDAVAAPPSTSSPPPPLPPSLPLGTRARHPTPDLAAAPHRTPRVRPGHPPAAPTGP